MFESVRVVGRGRVGTAVNERLRERQVSAHGDGADLVLLCVPDSAIRECAAAVWPGPCSRR
jgi:prephenate dehydrogenase